MKLMKNINWDRYRIRLLKVRYFIDHKARGWSSWCVARQSWSSFFTPQTWEKKNYKFQPMKELRKFEWNFVFPTATWGSWGSYGSCSKECDGGSQTQYRSCSGLGSCSGSSSYTRSCNTHECCKEYIHNLWKSWTRKCIARKYWQEL